MKIIKALYAIEDVCRPLEPQARQTYRLEQGAEKLLDDLAPFVAEEKQVVANSSPYYAALRYADNELPHIRNYLKHGAIELVTKLNRVPPQPFDD